jgi:hypothetical protein
LVLAGCGPPHPLYLKKDYASFPTRIAVLPMNNMTTDLDGPALVRGLTQKLVEMCGFESVPVDQIDGALKDKFGITDGGQLPSAAPRELGRALGVDGLLYGDLEEFNYINIGFFQNRIVEARYWLVDAATGEKLWEDEQKVIDPYIVTDVDEAKKALAVGLGVKWAEKAFHAALLPETAVMLNRIFETFPKKVNAYLPVVEAPGGRRTYQRTWGRRMQ